MNAGRNYNGPMVEEFITSNRVKCFASRDYVTFAALVKLGYMLETPSIFRYLSREASQEAKWDE